MPVEPSPLMLWSELLIQIFETVAQREYLVRWVTEQFHSATDARSGDLVGRLGLAAMRFTVPLPHRTRARPRHQRRRVQPRAPPLERAARPAIAFRGPRGEPSRR